MNIRDPHKLAENLLDAARTQAGTTSTIAFSWLVTLITLWVGSLEPIVPKLMILSDKTRISAQAANQLKLLKEKGSPQSAEFAQRLSEFQEYKRSVDDSVTKQVRELKVAFPVPGFPSFYVPTRFASLVWCVLLLGLVAYVTTARAKVFSLIGQAARLLSDHRTGETLDRPPVVLSTPWWMAPMPAQDGPHVRAAEFRALAGARESKLATVLVASTLVFLCLLQIRASLIAASVVLQLGERSDARTTPVLLVAACALAALVTILLSVGWFRHRVVPDQLSEEPDPNALGRRKAIFMAVGLPLAALIVGGSSMWKPSLITHWLRSPRYRRRRKAPLAEVSLAEGFYINKRSRVIQYVTSKLVGSRLSEPHVKKRFMIGVRLPKGRALKESNFTHVPDLLAIQGGTDTPRLNQTARIQAIERAARNAWLAGKREEACQLLWVEVLADLAKVRPRITEVLQSRIYYRLAKYALLSGQDSWIPQMIEAIQHAGVRYQFEVAIRSWTNSGSRWRKRLKYIG